MIEEKIEKSAGRKKKPSGIFFFAGNIEKVVENPVYNRLNKC